MPYTECPRSPNFQNKLTTVFPGSSDPPEIIFNTFASKTFAQIFEDEIANDGYGSVKKNYVPGSNRIRILALVNT